jgi:predicted membrane protein
MRARYFLGIALVLFGTVFLFDQLGLWNFGWLVSVAWPIIFVIVGISQIASTNKSFIGGLFFVTIGLLLIANNLDYLPYGFWGAFWPIILIFIGLSIIFRHRKFHKKNIVADSDINYFTMFSGANHKIESAGFKGGSISTFFGGTQLDLRRASLAPEGANLDLSCAFGGIEIKVPPDMRIQAIGTPILGALENKTNQNVDHNQITPVLKINYFVIFGGIEIKN